MRIKKFSYLLITFAMRFLIGLILASLQCKCKGTSSIGFLKALKVELIWIIKTVRVLKPCFNKRAISIISLFIEVLNSIFSSASVITQWLLS